MPLPTGTRLGPYQVVSAIGAGGMGEVYRARDTRLDRDVAIKILPEAFAADAERLARFEREAKTLASLNHPNIAAIHGIEEATGNNQPASAAASAGRPGRISALVMELVDGEDLSARIARGPVPAADAVAIARQIADALEAAHERGVIHRDLKPGNIKVRDDGTVKVLDFGLAKALDASGGSHPDLMNSPTITSPATQLGMILGTAAYMAPEQAKGRPVDKRADVWAFGAVLYEMLSGRRAFEGDDVSTTLAAVLMRDPDWTALPSSTPPALLTLMLRCLERDPRTRLRDIGEARVLLGSPESLRTPARTMGPGPHSRAAWTVAAAASVIALVAGGFWAREAGRADGGARIEASLAPPPGFDFGDGLALSPDGRRIVFSAVSDGDSVVSLWIRELSSGTPVRLAQTDGGTQPFWSPDGTHVAFFADGKLKKADLQGSPPQVICDAPSARGGAWGPDGRIVFAGTFRTGLEVVDSSGGKPQTLTTLDEGRREKSHRWPTFLPGGTHVLFVAQTGEAGAKDDASTIEALALADGSRTRLVAANSSPLYAPGFLLFWREGALRAQPFDATRLVVSGTVFPVASNVAYDGNEFAYATVAADGTLVYLAGSVRSDSHINIVDRSGRLIRTIAGPALVEGGISLSPDGRRLAAAVTAPGARDTDIWIYDLARGTSAPLTFGEGGDRYPIWSADGADVLYTNDSQTDGTIYRKPADGRGQAELIAGTPAGLWAFGWSRDGRWLLVGAQADQTADDLLRYDRDTRKLSPLVQSRANDSAGSLSPDERWLAYISEQSGRSEVYVRALGGGEDGLWQISTQGGTLPLWRADGRELYFVTPQRRLMVVDVDTRRGFVYSAPRELFGALFNGGNSFDRFYAPMPDGTGFIVDVLGARSTSLLTLVTNWTAKAGK